MPDDREPGTDIQHLLRKRNLHRGLADMYRDLDQIEYWRHMWLSSCALDLATAVYLARADATLDGARLVAHGEDPDVDAAE